MKKQVLQYKILIWKMEKDLYQVFSSSNFSSAFLDKEKIENKIQYLTLKLKLSPPAIENDFPFIMKNKVLHFKEERGLPMVKTVDGMFVLDLGAMNSTILPSLILDKIPLENLTPLKLKNIQTLFGENMDAPYVHVRGDFVIGENILAESNWTLADLKIPNIKGLLGLDALGEEFTLYPKEGVIKFEKNDFSEKLSHKLVRDFDGKIRALEFYCDSDEKSAILRLDTGSQVRGDLLKGSKLTTCGGLELKGKFEQVLNKNSTVFDRGVSLNLGWPWIKEFKKIKVSLKEGLIAFEK